MDRDDILKLLDDLLKEHEDAVDASVDEFIGTDREPERIARAQHEEYKRKVELAKEYIRNI